MANKVRPATVLRLEDDNRWLEVEAPPEVDTLVKARQWVKDTVDAGTYLVFPETTKILVTEETKTVRNVTRQ